MHDFGQEICAGISAAFQLVPALLHNLQYILLILKIGIKLKCEYLQRSYLQVQVRLFTAVNGRRTRDNGHKLGKKNIFT